MPLSEVGRPARDDAIATVHAALDAGVRLIDTADTYCVGADDIGHNERLVAEAVESWGGPRSHVVIATKGGHVRDAAGGWSVNGRPEHLRAAAHASRDRLGVDRIELYLFHRPDPGTPFERSIEALAALQQDGVIHRIGLANVEVDMLQRASRIIDVSTVQNELSPYAMTSLDVVAWCHRHRVPFMARAPLGGPLRARRLDSDPRLEPFVREALRLGVSTAQVVLAWIVSLSPIITAIPGARRTTTIRDSAAASHLVLDDMVGQRLDHVAQQMLGQAPPRS